MNSRLQRLGSQVDRLIDDGHDVVLGARGWAVACGLAIVLLLPTLVLPFGNDQGLYFTAGEKIVAGGVPYRDFIDIKPPLIYYTYAAAILLFGHGDIAIRLLDLLLQLASCAVLAILVRRAFRNDLVAAVVPLIYLLAYLGEGFGSQVQTESYVALLGCGMVLLISRRRTARAWLAAGVVGGMLFLLKFTLAIVVVPLLGLDAMEHRDGMRGMLRRWGAMLAGFCVIVAVAFLLLDSAGAIPAFNETQAFLGAYAANTWAVPAEWLKGVFTNLPRALAIDFSLPLVILAAIGLARSAMPGREEERRLLQIAGISMMLLLGTIALEAKYFPWHITRFFPYGAILVGGGLLSVLQWLRGTAWKSRPPAARWLLVLAVTLMVFFSPVAGYTWRILAPATKNVLRNSGSGATVDFVISDAANEDALAVARVVKPLYRPGDDVVAIAATSGEIYHECGVVPTFPFLHSVFVIARFAPPSWRENARRYLLDRPPRFLVIQTVDSMTNLTGNDDTALEAVRSLDGVGRMLDGSYRLLAHCGRVDVFLRND